MFFCYRHTSTDYLSSLSTTGKWNFEQFLLARDTSRHLYRFIEYVLAAYLSFRYPYCFSLLLLDCILQATIPAIIGWIQINGCCKNGRKRYIYMVNAMQSFIHSLLFNTFWFRYVRVLNSHFIKIVDRCMVILFYCWSISKLTISLIL